jgi:hypothetical protein
VQQWLQEEQTLYFVKGIKTVVEQWNNRIAIKKKLS